VTLKADSLTFDSKTGTVTATGGATLSRGEAQEARAGGTADPDRGPLRRNRRQDRQGGRALRAEGHRPCPGSKPPSPWCGSSPCSPPRPQGKLAGVLGAMTVPTGVALNITPVVVDGLILLKGTATAREVEAGPKASDTAARDQDLGEREGDSPSACSPIPGHRRWCSAPSRAGSRTGATCGCA
jgi:hypothetical protein